MGARQEDWGRRHDGMEEGMWEHRPPKKNNFKTITQSKTH